MTRWTLTVLVVGAGLGFAYQDRLVAAALTTFTGQSGVNASRPEVSPDGRLILGVRASIATRSLVAFVMNSDGSNRRDLPVARATWSPDGAKIIGLKEYGRDDRGIVVLNPDGTGETETGLRGSIGAARMLPEGRLLLARTTRDTVRRIQNWNWLVHAKDGSETPLTFAIPASQTVFISVSPSPDGKRIAFLALDQGSAADTSHKAFLYVMNLDGSGLRQLAELQRDAGGIAWSRDNRTLALADSYIPHPMPSGFVPDAIIVSVDVASGTVRRLTAHDRRYVDENPSWSPDGSIYFHSDRDGQTEIYRMNADGANQRRITSGSPG